MGTVFVFEPDADYGRVDVIRKAGKMPVKGLKYVASVTGRWKVLKILEFDQVEADLADRLDLVTGLDENAIVMGQAKVRKSSAYLAHTALVRIDVDVNSDLDELRGQIEGASGSDEVDVVMGEFDMLAVVVADDEGTLGSRIVDIRRIDGVNRTVSLRVIDYVSTSEGAKNVEGDHYVDPFTDD
jgi:uncharacterized protein with GYD domain